MNEEYKKIQDLLDKYMAGETSNEEEALLRDYFDTHGDDIPEDWKAYKALFSFVGFERLQLGEGTNDSEEKTKLEAVAFNSEEEKPSVPKNKHKSLFMIATLSVAASAAIILLITSIVKIGSSSWSGNQSECYAVIDGKVYTDQQTVHAEALDALADMASDQDDAFDALDMMR